MNPDQLPHCEFDPVTKQIRFRNCSDDEGAMVQTAENRIKQITKQLAGRSGLTNRVRRALAREQNALQRWVESKRANSVAQVDEISEDKKVKALGKKLRWLAKKSDRNLDSS
jgi:hypothetical protein